jgi:hypothetical protein
MLFSLLYLILRRMIGTGRRPQDERDIELLVRAPCRGLLACAFER